MFWAEQKYEIDGTVYETHIVGKTTATLSKRDFILIHDACKYDNLISTINDCLSEKWEQANYSYNEFYSMLDYTILYIDGLAIGYLIDLLTPKNYSKFCE
ncbi:MAG: hypothetical protein IJX16_04855 [Clostridia bacterium]|nr:hypothetical protein [Clostridia bacterium]